MVLVGTSRRYSVNTWLSVEKFQPSVLGSTFWHILKLPSGYQGCLCTVTGAVKSSSSIGRSKAVPLNAENLFNLPSSHALHPHEWVFRWACHQAMTETEDICCRRLGLGIINTLSSDEIFEIETFSVCSYIPFCKDWSLLIHMRTTTARRQ